MATQINYQKIMKQVNKPVTFLCIIAMPLIIVVCGSHGSSKGVCTMMHWYLDMTCFITIDDYILMFLIFLFVQFLLFLVLANSVAN